MISDDARSAMLHFSKSLLMDGCRGAMLAEPEAACTRAFHTSDWTEHVQLDTDEMDGTLDACDFYVHNLDGSTRAAYRCCPMNETVEELPL